MLPEGYNIWKDAADFVLAFSHRIGQPALIIDNLPPLCEMLNAYLVYLRPNSISLFCGPDFKRAK
jgi:hypothetical protein